MDGARIGAALRCQAADGHGVRAAPADAVPCARGLPGGARASGQRRSSDISGSSNDSDNDRCDRSSSNPTQADVRLVPGLIPNMHKALQRRYGRATEQNAKRLAASVDWASVSRAWQFELDDVLARHTPTCSKWS